MGAAVFSGGTVSSVISGSVTGGAVSRLFSVIAGAETGISRASASAKENSAERNV